MKRLAGTFRWAQTSYLWRVGEGVGGGLFNVITNFIPLENGDLGDYKYVHFSSTYNGDLGDAKYVNFSSYVRTSVLQT